MAEQIDAETRLLAILEIGSTATPDADGNLPEEAVRAIMSIAEGQVGDGAAMSLEPAPRGYKVKGRLRGKKSKVKKPRC